MKSNYDVVVIGTGLCARSFYEGIRSNSQDVRVCFIQVNKSRTKHHTAILKHGGMAQYWHKGLMSPGLDYLKEKGFDKKIVKEFDDKFCPKIDHSDMFMHISPLNESSFIAPHDLTINTGFIEEILQDSNKVHIKVNFQGVSTEMTANKLIVAASSVGCLDVLSIICKKIIN